MNTFARLTAVVMILLGILVMLFAIVGGVFGVARIGLGTVQPTPTFPPANPFFVIPQIVGAGIGLLVGLVMFIQGLILTALGEGIYLAAEIAQNTSETRRMLVYRPERVVTQPAPNTPANE
ncbi:MAG: hypothetical protein ACM3PY_00955 [Omnitrophica WOR_2 bacterium]